MLIHRTRTQHIYDRIGCQYNAPASYGTINGSFTSCDGDDQLPPGIYEENNQRLTYTQPPESLGVISTIPYTPFTPSSSNCQRLTSANLYTAAAALATTSSSAAESSATSSASSASETSSGASSASGSSSRSGSASGTAPSATGSAGGNAAAQGGNSGAEGLKVAGVLAAGVAGLIGALVAL